MVKLSIVVPVLNEQARLAAFLAHVRRHAPEAELVLVDGGSRDGTWEQAARLQEIHRLLLLRSPRGRATQMNAGARAASGEVLWFLHADSLLPPGCVAALDEAMADPALAGGCFRLRMPGTRLVYRVSDSLGNVAVDLFRIALGDHGIFCRRAIFERLGGYPAVPLMEDAMFYEAVQRYGGVRQLRPEIITSSRFYEAHGPLRTTLAYLLILALYVARAPLTWQVSVYTRLRRGGRGWPKHPAHPVLHAERSALPPAAIYSSDESAAA